MKTLSAIVALALPCLATAGSASMNVNWADATLTTSTGSAQLVNEPSFMVGFLSVRPSGAEEYSYNTKFGDSNGPALSFSGEGFVGGTAWGAATVNVHGGDVRMESTGAKFGFVEMAPHSVAKYQVPFAYSVDASSKYDLRSEAYFLMEVTGPYRMGEYGWTVGNHNDYLELIGSYPGVQDTKSEYWAAGTGEAYNGRGVIDFTLQNPTDMLVRMGMSAHLLATSVTAVPEPETYALTLSGLGLVGCMARRKKKRSQAA